MADTNQTENVRPKYKKIKGTRANNQKNFIFQFFYEYLVNHLSIHHFRNICQYGKTQVYNIYTVQNWTLNYSSLALLLYITIPLLDFSSTSHEVPSGSSIVIFSISFFPGGKISKLLMDIMTGGKFSSIQVPDLAINYWSVRSTSRRGGQGWDGGDHQFRQLQISLF